MIQFFLSEAHYLPENIGVLTEREGMDASHFLDEDVSAVVPSICVSKMLL